ncbi:hypothetical protein T02_15046 [Trichinella nativa]|uniref:Uncharacterized protein n=1 Tax=Trichinella nativa TaxID=6335 RepID=A0A0V1KKE1_9BILA|nr:hypothetical protein T02_15046 [Trichinella nativa]
MLARDQDSFCCIFSTFIVKRSPGFGVFPNPDDSNPDMKTQHNLWQVDSNPDMKTQLNPWQVVRLRHVHCPNEMNNKLIRTLI